MSSWPALRAKGRDRETTATCRVAGPRDAAACRPCCAWDGPTPLQWHRPPVPDRLQVRFAFRLPLNHNNHCSNLIQCLFSLCENSSWWPTSPNDLWGEINHCTNREPESVFRSLKRKTRRSGTQHNKRCYDKTTLTATFSHSPLTSNDIKFSTACFCEFNLLEEGFFGSKPEKSLRVCALLFLALLTYYSSFSSVSLAKEKKQWYPPPMAFGLVYVLLHTWKMLAECVEIYWKNRCSIFIEPSFYLM